MYFVVEWATMSMPQFERPLQHRRGESAVANRDRVAAGFARDRGDGGQIGDAASSGFEGVSTQISRVAGRMAARIAVWLGHIGISGFDAGAREDVRR